MHRTNRFRLTYLLHRDGGLPWRMAWCRAGLICAQRRQYTKRGAAL